MLDTLQLARLLWEGQAHWTAEWKITLIGYPLQKKVYETDQYAVENARLTGQGKYKTGLCQAENKEKLL